jgi:phage repressor protein C with HTH and peptisase S24 domain
MHDNRNINVGGLAVELQRHREAAMKLVQEIQAQIKRLPRDGKTQGELAKLLGVARTAVNNIGAGRRQIKAQELPVIIDYLQIDGAFELAPKDNRLKMIPVSGIVQAGVWREITMEDTRLDELYPEFPTQRYPGAPQYILELCGTSMNRHYNDGDMIYCVPLEHASLYDGAHVHVERTDAGGKVETTLKVYTETPAGVQLRPDSNDPRHQQPIAYDDKQDSSVEIRGVVVGSFRKSP